MSEPLTAEETNEYTNIIDSILATADLETISRKKIREGLEAELGGKDLSAQKIAIKELIVARFDAISQVNLEAVGVSDADESSNKKRPATNGTSGAGSTDASASPEPARKKAKRSSSVEDADARLAAQLQAQENRLARGRSTRGGGDKKVTKKAPRKKSAKKVKPDDDSDLEGSEAAPPKRKGGGGFQKPFNLSEPLQALCGQTQLSRPRVVKSLWEHIKANDLQDPNDKRQIRCDEKMHAIFKQARVDMFKMNKEIGNHLYPIEE